MLKNLFLISFFLLFFTLDCNSNTTQDALVAQEFNEKIKQFIINNPEIIVESLENYKKTSEERMEQKITSYIKNNLSIIQDIKSSPYAGNINGDVTIVMFYDYSCGYCKKANLVINELLNKDKNIKLIYKPYPVLGEKSSYVTRIALSIYLNFPDKFKEFHDKVMASSTISEDLIKVILKKCNIELPSSISKANLAKLEEVQKQTFLIGRELYISGVPVFIVNENLYMGMIGYDQLSSLISHLRQNDSYAQSK
jgi:protein-disulfide isomerase